MNFRVAKSYLLRPKAIYDSWFYQVKRDDWAPKIQYACLYLAFILAAYVTSFTRVALFLLLVSNKIIYATMANLNNVHSFQVHYISEAVFHTCRILAYLDKTAIASKLFKLGDALFVVARLSSVTMSVLTFWFGLASVPAELQVIGLVHCENRVWWALFSVFPSMLLDRTVHYHWFQVLDTATGNYNTPLVRLAALLAVCLLQAWLMYGWIMFQVKLWHAWNFSFLYRSFLV